MIGADPDARFMDIVPNWKLLNLSRIRDCYDMTLGEAEYNIFENNIFNSVQTYYVSVSSFSNSKTFF